MKKYLFLVFFTAIGIFSQVLADSPLTSTDISKAYQKEQIVQLAAATKGRLTPMLMDYLYEKKNPIEVKIAVINQLGWDTNGKNNSEIFFQYLSGKSGYKSTDDLLSNASADILICMAYLKALDNYFEVDEAIEWAITAKIKNKKSYTIQMIAALIEAQKAMDSDWCKVYQLANDVRINKALKKDMKDEAITLIFEYMELYKDECK